MNRSQRKITELMENKYPAETIDFSPEEFISGRAFEYEIIFEGALDETQLFSISSILPISRIKVLLADDCQKEHAINLRIDREDDPEYLDLDWLVEIYLLDEQGDRVGAPLWQAENAPC